MIRRYNMYLGEIGYNNFGSKIEVNDWWLLRNNVAEIAEKLGAPMVPYMVQFTIDEAIEFVRKGFKSTIAENKEYLAEGLVLTSPYGIKNRKGDRIIFKIKHTDFAKYKSYYGTDGPVEQIPRQIPEK